MNYYLIMCLKLLEKNTSYFKLDPAHYSSSTPGYSWDAMLRFNNVNLKLISDTERKKFIESTVRGSISMICKRYAEANNKLLNVTMLTNLLYISYTKALIIHMDILQSFTNYFKLQFWCEIAYSRKSLTKLLLLTKFLFWQGDWVLDSQYMKLWNFPDIS